MTKLRDPDTIHDAVRQAMVLIGDEQLATQLDCSAQLLQAYSDKDDQREITGARMIKTDTLLVQRGLDPVFAPLLAKCAADACPMAQSEPGQSPTAAVMSIAGTMGGALATMSRAAADGEVNTSAELNDCLGATDTLRADLARCRRVLFAALRRLAPATGKSSKARR